MPAWTDERTLLAKELWEKGISAGEIASQLGGITRNAVIGKVHRSIWGNRSKTGAPVEEKKPRKKSRSRIFTPKKAVEQQPVTDIESPADIFPERALIVSSSFNEGGPRPLLQLKSKDCRWPINDSTPTQGFLFCAAPVEEGCKTYCEAHRGVAFQDRSGRPFVPFLWPKKSGISPA